jgi:hypothetical protein
MNEEKLIDCIVDYMTKNQLSDLLSKAQTYINENSWWGEICRHYCGRYDTKTAMRIKGFYSRNYNEIHQIVSSFQQFCIKLNASEWKTIKKHINQACRKRFNAGFTHFLSTKLQELGVHCYLDSTERNNWFKIGLDSWNGN